MKAAYIDYIHMNKKIFLEYVFEDKNTLVI